MVSGRAVDVLLNYETVKLFNNQQFEVARYDEYLVGYQRYVGVCVWWGGLLVGVCVCLFVVGCCDRGVWGCTVCVWYVCVV